MKSLLRKCRGENYLFVVNQNHPSISAYFVGESACIGEAVRQKEKEDMHVNRVYVFAIYFFKPKFELALMQLTLPLWTLCPTSIDRTFKC